VTQPVPAGAPRPRRAGLLDAVVVRWVRAARRAWLAVLLLALAGSALAAGYAARNLGINTDTADMIAPTLPWRQRHIDFREQFPHFEDNLVIVIDARTPDLAASAADRLTDALRAHRERFHEVQWTQGLAFFRRNALLLMDAGQREELAEDLVRAQPLLGRLHRDPGLASVASLLADGLRESGMAPAGILDRFAGEVAEAMEATLDGRFHRLSWRRLVDSGADGAAAGDAREVVLARPVLDYSRLFPAEHAIEQVRATARALGLAEARGVRVRITGGVAMSEEELRTVSTGAGRAALLALAGVALVLLVGLGSARLVLACVLTLVAGLAWTAAFAAAAVGSLNMISVAFAVLYIGLGVDYAVHYALRYRELLGEGVPHAAALERAAGDVGTALALCALTTGAGFFAFVPTRFAGVSELGLIAGVGMFVSLVATLTLMPALLTAIGPRAAGARRAPVALPLGGTLDRLGRAHPRAVCAGALAAAAIAAAVAAGARFDDNPLNLRDAGGEAVSTYRELVADSAQWSLELLVADAQRAERLAARLEALPEVRRVVRLASFVPEQQDAALARIEELALVLGPDLYGAPQPASDPGAAAGPLRELARTLEAGSGTNGPGAQRLQHVLARVLEALDATGEGERQRLLRSLQDAVTGTLPGELARLGDVLDAQRVSRDTLPQVVRRDWQAPDGRLRLRVDAAGDLNRREDLARFVEQVRRVAPQAGGTPVVHLESARVVVHAFAQAFALALACIAVILLLTLRRAVEVLVVLAPLLLAALLAAAVMTAAGIAFNFANVIALPLLLGVGVDSGVHMLARARTGAAGAPLAASATARGVVTSALTTVVSFGNLAFSAHPGTASMGFLLAVGMVATIACTLLLLPALVALAGRGTAAPEAAR